MLKMYLPLLPSRLGHGVQRRSLRRARRSQRGITLVEALVALLITAIGILGVVGVQLRTLADTQTGVRRAQAVRLIEDLSERIKVNPNPLDPAVLANYAQPWGDVSGSVPGCAGGCSAQDLATFQIDAWKRSVTAMLPLGDAATFVVADETDASGNRRQLGVMLRWRENERRTEDESDADAATYRAPFVTSSTGSAGVSCEDGYICHLQYIPLTARCLPDLYAGTAVTGVASAVVCPG